ncbi:hypothetical protein HHI36_021475 [Cryptolaemus montrouzieri]|uniref:Ionotropic receptor n=1 Tax=Cryptolaemus montrouzieri TaxID=559131 RepID=A0ABD2MXZ2_9CUCU
MISAVIFRSKILFCINILLAKLDGNIFSVNSDEKTNFPTVQVDLKQPKILDVFPDVYIVNAEITEMNRFLKLREILGFKDSTKYIFTGNNKTFQFPSVFNDDAIFINSATGKIYMRNVNKNQDLGNCFETDSNFTNIFAKEMDFRGKELSVCTHKYAPFAFENNTRRGIDVEIVGMALDLLGIGVKFLVFPYPIGDIDVYLTKMFTMKICDIYSGIKFRKLFDCTDTHIFDSLHWVIKTPEEMPRWKYAFKIFTLDIWLSCIISTIFISIAYHLTMIKSRSFKRIRNLPQGFLITLKLFLEQSHSWKTSNVSRTIILIIMLFSSCMINAFFKSKFAYLLSGFNLDDPIDSFEAIMANKMIIKMPLNMKQVFDDEPKAAEYLKKYLILSDPSVEIYNVIHQNNIATTIPKTMFEWEMNNYLSEDMRPLLQMINQPIIYILFSMILPKGSSLKEPLNEKLGYLHDHGLVSYIKSKYKVLTAQRDPTLDVKKLTINHIQLPLSIWIIGIITACITYLFESKLKKKLTKC